MSLFRFWFCVVCFLLFCWCVRVFWCFGVLCWFVVLVVGDLGVEGDVVGLWVGLVVGVFLGAVRVGLVSLMKLLDLLPV
ncbi:hypothetical protein, partial [Pseudomonas syringae group genomosp. 7]|uniref:hypothetical protein n=1 Tax=Pseudomonas syringae group genomosp. 7 TaxID=251699 RepID=UPI0037705FA7